MLRRTIEPRQRRYVGAILALGINLLIAAMLIWASRPTVSIPSATNLQVISLVLATPASRTPPPARPPVERERLTRHSTVRRLQARSAVPIVIGPPSERVAALPPVVEIADAQLVDEAELLTLCGPATGTTLSARDSEVTVSLRVFVLPDGRIAQGRIERSSGDAEVDRAVFACIQTYANVQPAIVDDDPVGSWQLLTTRLRAE